MSFLTLPGFRDAIHAASELEAFEPNTPDEYSRGQAELIAALFIRNDPDPGSGEVYEFIRTAILRGA